MAGHSSKEIRGRIRSMESTRQITRAMEMVASSKLRRAQEQILASRPYFQTLSDTMDEILANNRDLCSPYLKGRPGNRHLYIVIAGDRGLAGGYNSNILKTAMEVMHGRDAVVLPIGKKAAAFFRSRRIPLFGDAMDMDIGSCFSLAQEICRAFLENEFDTVHIVYTVFASVLSQVPTHNQLLPLKSHGTHPRGDTIYEPSAEEVFAAIVPEYLGGILYGALCESRAAEHAARRTAMNAATGNADEMIAGLKLVYNRSRQRAITQEITEIVAGS